MCYCYRRWRGVTPQGHGSWTLFLFLFLFFFVLFCFVLFVFFLFFFLFFFYTGHRLFFPISRVSVGYTVSKVRMAETLQRFFGGADTEYYPSLKYHTKEFVIRLWLSALAMTVKYTTDSASSKCFC